MIRPFLTAVIEYLLAYWVYKNGKLYPKVFSALLFLLATYQLGEIIIFASNGNRIGFQIAYFSTTLLPPFGLLFMELTTKKNYFYIPVQIIALFFAGIFLINSTIIGDFEIGDYCIKVLSYNSPIVTYWSYYYQGTLTFTMMIMIYNYFTSKSEFVKKFMLHMLVAYVSFDIVALIFVRVATGYRSALASVMCALAVFASIIFARVSLKGNLLFDTEERMREYFDSKAKFLKNLLPKF